MITIYGKLGKVVLRVIRLVYVETKNFLKRRDIQLILIIGILLSIIIGNLFVRGIMVDKVLDDGSVEIVKYREAIKLKEQYDAKYSGDITIEKLNIARNIYNNSYDEIKDKTIISKQLLEISQLYGTMQSLLYPISEEMILIKWNGRDIPVEYASDFYDLRNKMLVKYANNLENKKISEKIIENEKKIIKPFIYGVNYSNWSDAIEWLTMLIMIICIFCILASSSVFSELNGNGLREIISFTINGKKIVSIRIFVLILFNIILYCSMVGIYIYIVYHYLGGKGLYTSIQVDMPFSPAPFMLLDAIKFEIIGGIVGIIAVSMMSMLLSSIFKSSWHSISVAMIILLSYIMLSVFIRTKNHILIVLLSLSPFSLSQVFFELPHQKYISFGSIVIWLPIFMFIVVFIKIIIYEVLLRHIWNKWRNV